MGRWLLAASVASSAVAAQADDVARGDAAWARRAEGERDGRPEADAILDAVRSYESALAADPGSLEARWKLLRALHFAGEFAYTDPEDERESFARATDLAEQGLALLEDRASLGAELEEIAPDGIGGRLEAADLDPGDAARLYFWSAIGWAAWSRDVGLLSAVGEGVANRLHRYLSLAIALEPAVEDGGAFRLLARLHARLPRVPFVSGWVDRDQALPLIERAYAMSPANPGNRLLLALTLLDLAPVRSQEALDLLKQVEALTPRPSMRIEDLAMRREARDRLASVSAANPT
jgi:tetratricopeptide (TPR) repeat protein